MVCASCGWATTAGARFCAGCGASLTPHCAACGAESQTNARFCSACGVSLGAQAAARPAEDAVARKVVTIVFADLVGSTALHERLDAEAVRQFMEGYYAAIRGAVEAHGGRVTQLMGDGVKAVFGAPRVAEDDAIRAVRAAVEMQRAFRALADDQRERIGKTGLRVAVNTGEVVADDASEIIGDPVNVAARLQEQGQDGDVVIGGPTQRIVASLVTLERLGSFALKGRSEAVEAYRVVSLEAPAGAAATPFVGRDDELRRLAAVYDAAVTAPAARLAVLLGSPGLGKSRLVAELGRQLQGRARVLAAQCNPAGGATFAPLAEALRANLGLEAGTTGDALRAALDALVAPGDDAERARMAVGIDALFAGTAALPEEIFFVVRRLLSALAVEQPVVLAIDDVQWAEPLLLDFTEHLVQWGAGIPLLVLVAARPELRDTRSSFTTAGGLVSDVVTLGGLDAGAAMRLAANVIGADTLPAAVAGRVLTTSEGNPLFLRELVRMLVNDGTLRREGERWTLAVDLAALEMPPTIQALLAARIERLRPEERLVLERAAVVGRQFSRAAVTHLLPREAHADLDARLEALRRSELIEADAGWLLGEPTLRFHHVLIRDAAYRRVLRGTRAELHARFADWLEARAGESVEHEETIGWHLEQAHQHLLELGPLDAKGHALGERAGRHLAAAGRGALARDDLEPAASLLGRALDCLGDADPARGALALDWCEAVLSAGNVGTASRAIAELGRFTADSERLRAWHTCFTSQLAALADPKALRTSAEAVVAAAETLAAAGDLAGEAKAHAVHAEALMRLGEIGACEAALDKALAAARRAGDRRRANTVLSGAPLAALWGPSPVKRASGRCLDVVRVLRITQGAPAVEAVALRCQAVLETLRGRSEAARRMIASSRRLVEELGITQRLLEVDASAGLIELLEGDAVAAERWLRPAYEGFRAHGLGVDAARAAALLGRALLAQGCVAEAEALSHESEALAGDDFQAAIDWRGARALALSNRGEHAAALELARAAVEIAAGTDDLLDHAAARSALAVALRAAGRREEAEREEAHATQLWEQKGATLLVERARRSAARVAPADRAPEVRVEPTPPTRRTVCSSALISVAAAVDAAFAAGDMNAFAVLQSESLVFVDHPTQATYGLEGFLAGIAALRRSRDASLRHEPIATLGDDLGLFRHLAFASAVAGARFDVGAYEREAYIVGELDTRGRVARLELFASDRLGDAIARLYERYADLLPDGPEKVRAAATARSVAMLLREPAHRWPFAPDAEATDHRTVGFGSLRGADAVVRAARALHDLTEGWANRNDDVLGLRSDALLVLRANSGTQREGGGAYERILLQLWVFGADGLLKHWEQFEADREAEALARFDELSAEPPGPRPVRRRVRPNAATANAARIDAAASAGDTDAAFTLLADDLEMVDHPNGVTYDRRGLLTWISQLANQAPTLRHEPIATIGDSIALFRFSVSASRLAGDTFDIGAFESQSIAVIEVDAQGRRRRVEVFAVDHLGAAVARLYERRAELLPDGPERVRAAATARSVAAMQGPFVPDRRAAALAPAIEVVDHRILGTWSARGREALLAHFRSALDLADVAMRDDDILALQPDAFLGRRTISGTLRSGGGAMEVPLLGLALFGTDGLLTRLEFFDADRDAEALARFDELTAEPPPARPVRRRVRPNAATEYARRLDAAMARGRMDEVPALFADDLRLVDHRHGIEIGRDATIHRLRDFTRVTRGLVFWHEALATLGSALALTRFFTGGEETTDLAFSVGASQDSLALLAEVEPDGRASRIEMFAEERLGQAIARLYERHAERLPEGPERERAAATARSVAALMGEPDLDRWASAFSPTIEWLDRRSVGAGRICGADAVRRTIGAFLELTDRFSGRVDDVLALRSDGYVVLYTTFGTDRAGGAFERRLCNVELFGPDGLLAHWEQLDADRIEDALARFDALAVEPRPAVRRRVRPNHGTAHAARMNAAIAALDAAAVRAAVSDGFQGVHHPTGREWGVQEALDYWRLRFTEDRDFVSHQEPVAALGDSLALCRMYQAASGSADSALDVGSYQMDAVTLLEGDPEGRAVRVELFAPDRLGDAVVRLYERYAELLPEGPERTRATAIARTLADIDPMLAAFAPDIEAVDHRMLGTWSARGAEALRGHFRSLFELVDAVPLRFDEVLALQSDGLLVRSTNLGTLRAGGGSYERPFLILYRFGSDGLLTRIEYFDPDRDADALARFDELTRKPPPRIENAATRWVERFVAACEARDLAALAAGVAPDMRHIDRRRMLRLDLDRSQHLEWMRTAFERRFRTSFEVLATRGDRLVLGRARSLESDEIVGPSEHEFLGIGEVNDRGECLAQVFLDADDLGAAYAELDARYAAGEGRACAHALANFREWKDAFERRDPEALRAHYASVASGRDHRIMGFGAPSAPELVDLQRQLAELSPDVRIRVDHFAGCARGALWVGAFVGTRTGGAFEMPRVMVRELGAGGELVRVDLYDLDQLDAACARFAELHADPPRA